jgi:hypothetical protein
MLGKLEVMAYSYWHLSTTDLVDWPIDNISKTEKHILEHVCQYLPVHLKSKIATLAKFDSIKTISSQCRLVIKQNFDDILNYLINTYKNPESKEFDLLMFKKLTTLWKLFMQKCNVHHYYCPHTKKAIVKFMNFTIQNFKPTVDRYLMQHKEFSEVLEISKSDIVQLFGFWGYGINRRQDVTTQLQRHISSFYAKCCRLLGSWVAKSRILERKDPLINHNFIGGFVEHYHYLL